MAQRLIWIAAGYLLIGACLGLSMGITRNFTLIPVHAHILLAGWLTLAMSGVIYRLYPVAGETLLAKTHFWLHNMGLPMFMLGLACTLTGRNIPAVLPAGAVMLLLGLVCFSINIWRRVRG